MTPSDTLAKKAAEVLSLEALCELLETDSRTIWRWRKLKRRPLPAHKINGGKVFFFKDEVLRWLRSHRDVPETASPRKTKRTAHAGR